MRRMHVGIVLAGALVGVVGAVVVARLKHQDPGPEQTAFVSADGQSVIELPEEPTPLPAEGSEPTPISEVTDPVLLDPVPMPGIEVTVAHRSAEPVPEDVKGEDPASAPAAPAPEVGGAVAACPEELPMPVLVEDAVEKMPATVISSPPSVVPEPVAVAPEPVTAAPEPVAVNPEPATEPTPPGVVVASPPTPPAPQSPTEPTTPVTKPPVASEVPPPAAHPPVVVRPAPLPLPEFVMAAARKHVNHTEVLPLTGSYDCNLENQTELNLSASARTELERPHVLFVALAPDKKCLWVYTAAGIDRLADQLDKASGNDEMARCTRRKCFSRIHRVHSTTDGTFLIPVDLVEIACLKGNVLLIGVRDHFELWDQHQWQQYIGQEEPAEPPAEPIAPPHSGGGCAPMDFGFGWLQRFHVVTDGSTFVHMERLEPMAGEATWMPHGALGSLPQQFRFGWMSLFGLSPAPAPPVPPCGSTGLVF